MFDLTAKEFSDKYYCKELKTQSNNYYRLDCESGEGLINPLLENLEKNFITSKKPEAERKQEFEFYLEFFLRKCININRSFSDAVWFLSMWLKISPDSLLEALKNVGTKKFFNRTEYDHDGDQWYFPKLLKVFSTLVEKKQVTANEILHYLFETFDFFSMPGVFVTEIIGYERLEKCIDESPAIFKHALLSKLDEFVEQNKTIDMGSRSRKYLNAEIHVIDSVKRIKVEPCKQTRNKELVSYIKNHLFIPPSIKNFNPSEPHIFSPQSAYSRGSISY